MKRNRKESLPAERGPVQKAGQWRIFLLFWVRMCEWEDNNQGTEQETKSANFDYVK